MVGSDTLDGGSVFAWDIYKYRSAGPKLRFTAQTGMETVNAPFYEGKTLIVANVTNYGDRPTTITTVAFEYFKGSRRWRKKKPVKAAVTLTPSVTQPLPFELKPGVVWTGLIIQNPEIEEWATTGILDMLVYHSHTGKPLRQRIAIKKRK
jgi:hypothetical protein